MDSVDGPQWEEGASRGRGYCTTAGFLCQEARVSPIGSHTWAFLLVIIETVDLAGLHSKDVIAFGPSHSQGLKLQG